MQHEDQNPARRGYSSFGDQETTASVNSRGHLIQISRYLGVGKSGMFCVNSSSVVNPRLYFVRYRASQLTKSAEDPSSGFGLQLETISDQPFEQPELDFIHDRWPQFTHRTTEWTTTLLYYVNEGTIIQECVIKKSTAHKEPSNGQKDDMKVQSHQNQASQASEGHINDNQLDANQSSEKSNQESRREEPSVQENSEPTSPGQPLFPRLAFNTDLRIHDLHGQYAQGLEGDTSSPPVLEKQGLRRDHFKGSRPRYSLI